MQSIIVNSIMDSDNIPIKLDNKQKKIRSGSSKICEKRAFDKSRDDFKNEISILIKETISKWRVENVHKKITIQNLVRIMVKVFDFDTGTGRHGYAIFGEIGRGKTTLVESVLWCLYGRVVATKVLDGKQLKKNRPLIDASQMTGEYTKKWYLPLLNFQAWYNSDFQFSVKIDFEHNSRNYTLLRDVNCKGSSRPNTDSDMNNIHICL